MGPPGLWPELRRLGAGKNLHGPEVELLLKRKTVAVDGAVWLYEAQMQGDLLHSYGAEGAALKVTFERCVRWLRKGVLPVVVLEGTAGGRGSRTFSRGRGGLGSAFAPQPLVRSLLIALGVPVVDAEGEAEATCAALAIAGHCDFVATTDFDALLFGAPRVVRNLDLQDGVTSKCELWEAAAIKDSTGLDRHALVAAAFLVGCDYDCRSSSRSTPHDGKGVRCIGARRAVQLAQALSAQGSGNALQALSGMVFDMRMPEAEAPADAKDAKEKAKTVRALSRTMSRAAEDPNCKEGFTVAVGQYNRILNGAAQIFNGGRPFVWRGVNDAAAEVILTRIFPGTASEKLQPLQLEWALRVVAAECPAAICKDKLNRQKWALQRGLRYVPLSAKWPNRRKSGGVPYVLTEFALAQGDTQPVRIKSQKRHARVSLAEACRLLAKEGDRGLCNKNQRSLKDMLQTSVGASASRSPSPVLPSLSATPEVSRKDDHSHRSCAGKSPPQAVSRRKSLFSRTASKRQLRLSNFGKRVSCSQGSLEGAELAAVDKKGEGSCSAAKAGDRAQESKAKEERKHGKGEAQHNCELNANRQAETQEQKEKPGRKLMREAAKPHDSATDGPNMDISRIGPRQTFPQDARVNAAPTQPPICESSCQASQVQFAKAHVRTDNESSITVKRKKTLPPAEAGYRPVKARSEYAECESVEAGKIHSAQPRDTTMGNIIQFFTRSWRPAPSHQSSSQMPQKNTDPGAIITSREPLQGQGGSLDQGAETTMQLESGSSAPATPRARRRTLLPATTPQKRPRRRSLGGFCHVAPYKMHEQYFCCTQPTKRAADIEVYMAGPKRKSRKMSSADGCTVLPAKLATKALTHFPGPLIPCQPKVSPLKAAQQSVVVDLTEE